MQLKKIAFLLLGMTLSIAGCSKKASNQNETVQMYSNVSTDAGFDTIFYYQEYNMDTNAAKSHFETATSLFKHYNDLFDIYNTYDGINNLKTINDAAGKEAIKVDGDIIELLSLAKSFYSYSQQEFDITLGNLLQVWHAYREDGIALNNDGKQGNVPPLETLQEASSHKGWDHVQINADNQTVYIDDASVSLDVGGIAKGFATEKIAEKLESLDDIGVVAINAGGNNRTIGNKPDGSDWHVRIQNPDGGDKLMIVSQLGSMSFVTSGDYERYYTALDGKRYHHIIDPKTLFPADLYRSVTIITKDSGAADALSTSLFTLNIEDGEKLLDEYTKQTGNDAQAIWILNTANDGPNMTNHMNYRICYTDGLKNTITFE